MAKNKVSIDEKLKELEREATRLRVLQSFVKELTERMNWNYCSVKRGEDGKCVLDENDEYIFEEPQEGDWKYDEYVVAVELLEKISNL